MRSLERILRPKSIAVIGGGPWGASVLEACQRMGFGGALYVVHPSKTELAGVRCYRTIEDLPEPPDACFVGVNRDATLDAVRRLRDTGAGGVVAFAGGFSEAASEDPTAVAREADLCRAAGDMPLIGPNCYGFINYLDGALLWPDQEGGQRVPRGVAVIAQSSNMAINLTMQKRGLPVAYMMTVGNQAQTGMSDIGAALLEDDRVTALGLHIEGIDDVRRFEEMARVARRLGKPVVALKVGASPQAQAATLSHTASVAGNMAGARAFLDRLGIARVDTLTGFIEALKLAHVAGTRPLARVASMSCSGGEVSLMADAGLAAGTIFPDVTAARKKVLSDLLGPRVPISNPLDYNTYIWHDPDKMTAVFSAMMDRQIDLGIVVLDIPRNDRCDPQAWTRVLDCIATAAGSASGVMAVLASLPENMPEDTAAWLIDRGIVPLCGIDDGLHAAARLGAVVRVEADAVLLGAAAADGPVEMLTEFAAKRLLASHGVDVPGGTDAATAAEAASSAAALGWPVALKGKGFAHKSEAGAVVLNLTTEAAVLDAARGMDGSGFLVEEMIDGGIVELLVGVLADPAHGLVLTLGAGGTRTEVLGDTVSLMVPATPDAVRHALGRLRIAPLLAGYRGARGVDMDAVTGAIMAIQDCVSARSDCIVELEINPLICTDQRAVAGDALIRLRRPE